MPVDAIEIVHGSLEDLPSLQRAVEETDVVFHLAGVTKVLHTDDFYRINAQGTENLLRACREAAPRLRRFLFVSSLAAAGPSLDGQPRRESDPARPVSHYGKSKLAAEKAVAGFAEAFPVSICRPPVVYGPGDRDVYNYFKQVQMGLALQLGRSDPQLSIVHVQDLVDGLLAVAFSDRAVGQTYFLANAEGYRWSEIGAIIARALDKQPLHLVVPEFVAPVVAGISEGIARIQRKPALLGFDKIREMREKFWICSAGKAKRELAWQAKIDLSKGIAQTVEWYRAEGWL